MPVIDTDVEEIIDETIEDPSRKRLLRQILRWEEERMYDTVRTGKKNEFDEKINQYLKDQ